jgi:RNA polymerase sigma-70 factor (ECF subfamily)
MLRWPPAHPQHAVDAEVTAKVRLAVRDLPAKYREVVVLRYLEEMDVEQVARLLKISRSAVDVRLHRARKMLRTALAGLHED